MAMLKMISKVKSLDSIHSIVTQGEICIGQYKVPNIYTA